MANSSRKSVYAALVGNSLVALTKIGAAFWTGSAAMMSEAIHSAVDTSNEILLLYGYHRAGRPPDRMHPLGYGRELYFWSFIVALLILALGAGVSIYQGAMRILAPQAMEQPLVNFIVLGLSFIFEGTTWLIALRSVRSESRQVGWYKAFLRSKDPPAYMVLFEDSAALIGIVIAAAAIGAATLLEQPIWDGVGSVLIGLLLAATSMLLARETQSLLIGEPAHPALTGSILEIAEKTPGARQRRPDHTDVTVARRRGHEHRVCRRQAGGRYRRDGHRDREPRPKGASERPGALHQAADTRAL
jgi:cation diffusion facilitator family transporter